MSPDVVSVGEKEEGHSCRWTKNRKGAGTNSGESSARNLEAESITSTVGCVKLNTITGGSNQPLQQKTAVVGWVKSTTTAEDSSGGMGQINNPSTTALLY